MSHIKKHLVGIKRDSALLESFADIRNCYGLSSQHHKHCSLSYSAKNLINTSGIYIIFPGSPLGTALLTNLYLTFLLSLQQEQNFNLKFPPVHRCLFSCRKWIKLSAYSHQLSVVLKHFTTVINIVICSDCITPHNILRLLGHTPKRKVTRHSD